MRQPDSAIGFIGAIIAVLGFGTYAVPVKLVPTGDGILFQWFVSCSILICGILAECISGTPRIFEPLGMLGGMLWCIGNVTVIPIVNTIGLGMGLLIWGLVNMLTGWLCGHFGIIVKKEEVAHPLLNILGVVVASVSLLLYFPIKTSTEKVQDPEEEPLVTNWQPNSESFVDFSNILKEDNKKSELKKKLIGIFLSIIAGLFYGVNLIPISYLQEKNPDANPLAYALSHFSGIFITSTVIVAIYCIYKKNMPKFYPQSLLPGLFAGILWGIATCGWFIGNENLGLTIAFPIICTGPGIIGSLWGVFVFKEIQGIKNIIMLIFAFAVTITGILLITFSHGI
jgi:glucose uptake protein GlcU